MHHRLRIVSEDFPISHWIEVRHGLSDDTETLYVMKAEASMQIARGLPEEATGRAHQRGKRHGHKSGD